MNVLLSYFGSVLDASDFVRQVAHDFLVFELAWRSCDCLLFNTSLLLMVSMWPILEQCRNGLKETRAAGF